MPRPLLFALVSVAWLPVAYAQDVDAKRLPAVKRALDKADATILRNRKAYDEANEKALAEAEKELLKEVDRLSKAGKPEEAVAVKTLATGLRKKFAPPNPDWAGAVAWNGHKYKYFAEALSWQDAKKKCEEMGGYLVIIDNQQEQDFICRSLTAMPIVPKEIWLGVFLDAGQKQWLTVNGSPINFAKWGRSEPSGDGSHALIWVRSPEGFWNDYRGDIKAPYVCEWND